MVANVSVWSFNAISTFTFKGVGLVVGAKKGKAEEQEEKKGKGGRCGGGGKH